MHAVLGLSCISMHTYPTEATESVHTKCYYLLLEIESPQINTHTYTTLLLQLNDVQDFFNLLVCLMQAHLFP